MKIKSLNRYGPLFSSMTILLLDLSEKLPSSHAMSFWLLALDSQSA